MFPDCSDISLKWTGEIINDDEFYRALPGGSSAKKHSYDRLYLSVFTDNLGM